MADINRWTDADTRAIAAAADEADRKEREAGYFRLAIAKMKADNKASAVKRRERRERVNFWTGVLVFVGSAVVFVAMKRLFFDHGPSLGDKIRTRDTERRTKEALDKILNSRNL